MGSVAVPVETTVIVGAPRRSKGLGSGGNGGRGSPNSGPSAGSPQRAGGQQGSGQGAGATTPAARTGPTPTDRTTPTQISPATHTPAADASPAVKPVPAPAARRPFTPEPTLAGAGVQPVDGLLVAGPGTLLPSTSPLPSVPAGAQQGARAGNPAGGRIELPSGVILAVGIFALGALYERRGLRARTL
jgi:hypothetical protein